MPFSRRLFLGTAALAAAQMAQQNASAGDAQERLPDGNWSFSERDAAIAAPIQALLPPRLFDIHAHLYRTPDLGTPCPELTVQGPELVTRQIWRARLEQLTGPGRLAGGLFLPYPVKHGDVEAGNAFLASELKDEAPVRGLIVVTPQYPREQAEGYLRNPRIVGFKPYHVFASVPQTFDAALEEYLPEWVWEMAHAHRAVILLHLVRAAALSDPDNQRAIRTRCAKYPRAKLLLAHAGRGFHAPNTIRALPALKDLDNVYFDSAAVCEPDALMAILKTFGARRLLWGSDFPVSQQRGKCVTVGDAFSWICPRRIDVDPAAPACHPTLVGIESLRALGLATQLLDLTPRDLEDIYWNNAQRLLGIESA